MLQSDTFEYRDSAGNCYQGFWARESDAGEKCPLVLIAHTIRGRTDFEDEKALELARAGYMGVALDIYGDGKQSRLPAEARSLMDSLNADRGLLLQRMQLALEAARNLPGCHPGQVAAIGFCFGGKCVLDLARAGERLSGVVSFHGVLDPPGETKPDFPIHAPVLLLHGWDDPLAPPEAVCALAEELTRCGASWELDAYGHTGHAFTNPEAKDPEKGLMFNPEANRRAWERMLKFLQGNFE